MSDRGGGEFWAFLAGLFIGGVTVGLLTPKSGPEIRREISEGADELKSRADKVLTTGRSRADEMIAEGREKADRMIKEGKAKADEIIRKGKAKIGEIKESVRKEVEGEDLDR